MTNIQILPIKQGPLLRILAICLLGYLFIGLFPEKANASAFSVSVYPPVIKINATAPVGLKSVIIVSNPTDQTETFDISFKHFTQADSETGQVRYLRSTELKLKDPLIFERIKIFDGEDEISSLELGPKQQKQLSIQFDITEEETISDYYFSIIFTSSKPTSDAQKNKSDILSAVATNVLLSIGPQATPQAEISEFSAPLFTNKGPVEFKVKATNLGEQFINARGHILIKNMFGQTVGSIGLTPTNILGLTSRFIPSDKQLSKAVWPETVLIGPYTATLYLKFSDNGPILTQTIRFIGAPIQILTISLIVISLLLVIRAKLKTRLKC